MIVAGNAAPGLMTVVVTVISQEVLMVDKQSGDCEELAAKISRIGVWEKPP